MVDWIAIRTEYETTSTSYRKLAEKYGVSFPTLRDRAKRESWIKSKEKTRDKIITKTLQKTVTKISTLEASRNVRHLQVWDKILSRVDSLADKDKLTVLTMTGKLVEVDVSHKALAELASAMDKIQKGHRLAEGLDKPESAGLGKLEELFSILAAGPVKRQ